MSCSLEDDCRFCHVDVIIDSKLEVKEVSCNVQNARNIGGSFHFVVQVLFFLF
jgi:hypothetical protein